MKHKHAEYVKAWADDSGSVQCHRDSNSEWLSVNHAVLFDTPCWQFRLTPKPMYLYATAKQFAGREAVLVTDATTKRYTDDNIRLTYIDGKLTAAEVITEGDGK